MENQRVLLIRGDKNKWYDQVIFISKADSRKQVPVDLVAEAEKIIAGCAEMKMYMDEVAADTDEKVAKPTNRSTKKKDVVFDVLLNVVMVLSCLTLAGVMVLMNIAA